MFTIKIKIEICRYIPYNSSYCFCRFNSASQKFLAILLDCSEPSNLKYMDFQSIAGYANCSRNGQQDLNATQCDPWHRAFNYPIFNLRIAELFKWNEFRIEMVGLVLIAIFICAIAFYLFSTLGEKYYSDNPIKILTIGFWALAICSPAVWMVLDRGNLDSLIFSVIILIDTLSSHIFITQCLFALLSIVKVYTSPLLLLMVIKGQNLSEKITLFIPLLACFVFLYPDFSRIKKIRLKHFSSPTE